MGGAPPTGREVRSKGTGEAEGARSERADWTDWVVRERRHQPDGRCCVEYGYGWGVRRQQPRVGRWCWPGWCDHVDHVPGGAIMSTHGHRQHEGTPSLTPRTVRLPPYRTPCLRRLPLPVEAGGGPSKRTTHEDWNWRFAVLIGRPEECRPSSANWRPLPERRHRTSIWQLPPRPPVIPRPQVDYGTHGSTHFNPNGVPVPPYRALSNSSPLSPALPPGQMRVSGLRPFPKGSTMLRKKQVRDAPPHLGVAWGLRPGYGGEGQQGGNRDG